MAEPLPSIHLKNAWNSTHPWIFQRLVEKPAQRPKPGSIVDVVGVDGVWIGRGFYNGHSRIALRMLENDPDIEVDAGWFAPQRALDMHGRNELPLVFPTIKHLESLLPFANAEQALEAGGTATLPVLFFVDPALADDPILDYIDTITLSYTFYPARPAPGPVAGVGTAGAG